MITENQISFTYGKIFNVKVSPPNCSLRYYRQRTIQTNKLSGRYVFDELLKVSVVVVDSDITKSKFYHILADLNKTASEKIRVQTTAILQGSIKFGQNVFCPVFEYKVISRSECTCTDFARHKG